jgi:hypothetical protein
MLNVALLAPQQRGAFGRKDEANGMNEEPQITFARTSLFGDWLRRHPPLMPFAIFFYYLFWKRLIFDGQAGLCFALREMISEALISLELLEARLQAKGEHCSSEQQ